MSTGYGFITTEVAVDCYPEVSLWVRVSARSLEVIYPHIPMPVYKVVKDADGFILYEYVAHVPNGTIHALSREEVIPEKGEKKERRGFPVVRFVKGDWKRKFIVATSVSFFEGLKEDAHVRVKGAVTDSEGKITRYEDAGIFPRSDLEIVGVEECP